MKIVYIKYIKITPIREDLIDDYDNIEGIELAGVKFLTTIKDSNHNEIKLTKDE